METYKYRFNQSVPAQDLEDTFMLALLAVESIYGHSKQAFAKIATPR
jgi:hypothetical protein